MKIKKAEAVTLTQKMSFFQSAGYQKKEENLVFEKMALEKASQKIEVEVVLTKTRAPNLLLLP